jgi:adenosylhomocysteine nucleosidase
MWMTLQHNLGKRWSPIIAFRSLSNLAGGRAGENEILTFFQLAADNSAIVVIAFLEKLADWN